MAFIANIPTGRVNYKNMYTRVEKVEFLKGSICKVDFGCYQEAPAVGEIPMVVLTKEFSSESYQATDPFEYAYLNTKTMFDIVQDNV
jgi:hypothetical protein